MQRLWLWLKSRFLLGRVWTDASTVCPGYYQKWGLPGCNSQKTGIFCKAFHWATPVGCLLCSFVSRSFPMLLNRFANKSMTERPPELRPAQKWIKLWRSFFVLMYALMCHGVGVSISYVSRSYVACEFSIIIDLLLADLFYVKRIYWPKIKGAKKKAIEKGEEIMYFQGIAFLQQEPSFRATESDSAHDLHVCYVVMKTSLQAIEVYRLLESAFTLPLDTTWILYLVLLFSTKQNLKCLIRTLLCGKLKNKKM